MIVFDLACPAGHIFEAWFGSSADYEDQRARKLVSCPLCGAGEVTKAVMAPAVGAKANRQVEVKSPPTMRDGSPSPDERKAMLAALARAQAKMLEGSEHVGMRFAAEARAIHAGEAPDRVIHGAATIADAKALVEDGVPVAPLPLPLLPPRDSTH